MTVGCVMRAKDNGEFIITRAVAVLLALLIALLSAGATSVITTNVNAEKIDSATRALQEVTPVVRQNTERIVAIETNLNNIEKTAGRIETKVDQLINEGNNG